MTTRVLLVKTSSLGDVIHALPAVTELHTALPGVTLDWVVEEALVAIPRLHPGVATVLPVALRRWRGSLWRASTRREIAAFAARLRATAYDVVVDAQGLLKSALVARTARGLRHGLDFRSAREPLGLFYDRCHRVGWDLHAVERNRELVARALGYVRSGPCDYGIRAAARRFDWLGAGDYAVVLHATSGDYKLWPEADWIELGRALAARGLRSVLPWGSPRERARSERLAAAIDGAVVAPRLDYEALAGLFAGARVAIGVDTGLAHLAAALGVPTVGIYCGTDPAATGIHGGARVRNLGGIRARPAADAVIAAMTAVMA